VMLGMMLEWSLKDWRRGMTEIGIGIVRMTELELACGFFFQLCVILLSLIDAFLCFPTQRPVYFCSCEAIKRPAFA